METGDNKAIREVTSAGKIENILLTDKVFFVRDFANIIYLLRDIVLVPDVESDLQDHQERI